MGLPSLADPRRAPLHRLFPEHYEASKRMIARDFLLLATAIVLAIVAAAAANAVVAA